MDTLGEYLSKLGKKQLHTAETEKYAHVTFFFNGGREQPYEGEDRILVPSPKVATYDLQPEMSAFEVKDKLVGAINTQEYDFIVVNFANGDMVGHTGVYNAIAKAVWAVDQCVKEVVEAAKANDYETIIIADMVMQTTLSMRMAVQTLLTHSTQYHSSMLQTTILQQ